MKTNTLQRILVITLVAIVLVLAGTTVFADIDISNVSATGSTMATGVQKVGGVVLGVLQAAAAAIAVIILIVLAVKYIMASPDGKADIKKSATGYIIGAVILFGATGLLGWLQSATKTAVSAGNTTSIGNTTSSITTVVKA